MPPFSNKYFLVIRTLKIYSFQLLKMQYSVINYCPCAVHYISMIYLFYNCKFSVHPTIHIAIGKCLNFPKNLSPAFSWRPQRFYYMYLSIVSCYHLSIGLRSPCHVHKPGYPLSAMIYTVCCLTSKSDKTETSNPGILQGGCMWVLSHFNSI